MFKTLFNSRLIVLIFIFVISLISCDGRDRKYMNNTEILQENNLLNKFSEQVKFVPNSPVAINTDTILSNGFNVKINYRSIENNAFYKVTKKEKDSIIKMNYKNFEAHIEVFKDDTPINQSTINKLLFSEFENASFSNQAIMQYVWVDHNKSSDDVLYLNTSFNIPETETFKDFIVAIDKKGTIRIEQNPTC
ncbi:DUF4738 domain-containing protein [uncultured Algibacter sp.]|uniref:DUF4738 domain-containing protein n=1 Tax=uncultured Algibacter sp. TaxID=298659 RepID=UPI002607669E|nr:DUF4738 domain-containing protein [uncultured Algibacter sp.]